MDKDTEIEGNLVVEGNILGKNGDRFSLKVEGNITAGKIDAGDITAGNIDAGHIKAGNIDAEDIKAGNINALDISSVTITAWDITARNINAGFIICETLKHSGKLVAKNVIDKRSRYTREEIKKGVFNVIYKYL